MYEDSFEVYKRHFSISLEKFTQLEICLYEYIM